jgi:hypothetical protein
MIERAILIEDHHEMLDRRLGVDVVRMTVMIVMSVIAIATEIVGEDGKSARERARGRENRSRRQKSRFHFFDAPEMRMFTIRNVLNTANDRAVSV